MASTILALVGVLAAGPLGAASALSNAPVDAVVAKAVNDEARVLAKARGVSLTRPVAVRVLGRAHLAAERDDLQRKSRSAEDARAEEALWGALGLGVARGARMVGGGAGDVTGLYDAGKKRLLLGNWEPWSTGTFARTRDIAQAVLDARFEVGRLLRAEDSRGGGVELQSDVTLARQALWEGDATIQAIERMSPDGVLPPTRALGVTLEGLRESMLAESVGSLPLALARRLVVQLDGTMFAGVARSRLPWAAIDKMWARPPASTEQILHPETYQRGDAPDDVGARLPREWSGASSWKAALADTLGEIGVRAFLRRAVGEYRAERAATGWGGDRAILFREVKPSAGDAVAPAEFAAWVTTWDGITDAQDFADQASVALAALAAAPLTEVVAPPPKKSSRASARTVARRWRGVDARGRLFAMEERGGAVGLLVGAPTEGDELLAKLMTAALRKGGRAGARAAVPR